MKGQPGFFDLAERHDKLTQMRDPPVMLKKEVDWEAFRGGLAKMHEKDRKSAAGAKPCDVVRMFKLLILQRTYNLSDGQNRPLTDARKASNKSKSKTRVRVEHVFATQPARSRRGGDATD